MPSDAIVLERLVVGSAPSISRSLGQVEGEEFVNVQLFFKDPVGSPGSTRRPPAMEMWDDAGRVYEPTNADWAEPLPPATEVSHWVEFEIAQDAVNLELVLAPGEPDEAHIALSEI